MIPALLALASGGILARTVLWPFELHLERRHLAKVAARVATLDAELNPNHPGGTR